MQHFYNVDPNRKAIIDIEELQSLTSKTFTEKIIEATNGKDVFNLTVSNGFYITISFIAVDHFYNDKLEEAVQHNNATVYQCSYRKRDHGDYIDIEAINLTTLLSVGIKTLIV